MTITINGSKQTLPAGATLADAVAQFSPFSDDPVIVQRNGQRVQPDADPALREGDTILIFPLLIGG